MAPVASPPAPPPAGPAPGRNRSKLLSIAVLALVALVAIGGVTWFVLGRSGRSSEASGTSSSTLPPVVQLVTAAGPDGSYSIGFPGRPDPSESLPQGKNADQQLMGWSEENAFDPAGGRAYLVISQRFAAPAEPVYQGLALDAIGAQFGADPSAATIETTMLGHPARRFSFTSGGTPSSGIAVVTADHIFLIMAIGSTPDDERQAVEASFRITAAP